MGEMTMQHSPQPQSPLDPPHPRGHRCSRMPSSASPRPTSLWAASDQVETQALGKQKITRGKKKSLLFVVLPGCQPFYIVCPSILSAWSSHIEHSLKQKKPPYLRCTPAPAPSSSQTRQRPMVSQPWGLSEPWIETMPSSTCFTPSLSFSAFNFPLLG